MIHSMGIATAGVVTGARRIGESGQTDDAPPADLVDTYRSTALRRRREDCTLFTQQADRTSSEVQVNVALVPSCREEWCPVIPPGPTGGGSYRDIYVSPADVRITSAGTGSQPRQ
jgi:hypothetical protein